MTFPATQPAQEALARISNGEGGISHVEFAAQVLADRRAAMGLTINQINEMAATILVVDHALDAANGRIIAMLASTQPISTSGAKPIATRQVVCVPVNASDLLCSALTELVDARRDLDARKYTSDENSRRKKFEQAAIKVADHCTQHRKSK